MITAGLIEFISLCAYMASIFGFDVVPVMPLALMAIGTAVLVLLELLDAVLEKKDGEALRA